MRFCKRCHLLDFVMNKSDIFFAQILGKISSKDEIRVINQVEYVDGLCQVRKKNIPAV